MFSCEICKIFKNTYFEEYLQTTHSVVHKGQGASLSGFTSTKTVKKVDINSNCILLFWLDEVLAQHILAILRNFSKFNVQQSFTIQI